MNLDWEYLQEKEKYFAAHPRLQQRRRYLIQNSGNDHLALILRARKLARFLSRHKLPKYLDFFKWIFIDFLRGKLKKFSGIYAFIGLPGEGKTLSMVAHIERVRLNYKNVLIATNFHYKNEQLQINHWLDIVKAASLAKKQRCPCIVAMDEIHITFDSADWQHFPSEMLSLLSFNRKYNLQFICSSQIYDRVPKKIRDICNYVVICKNVWNKDRLFKNYYYEKSNYDTVFDGKLKKADFIRDYIADDDLYSLYDTKELVDNLVDNAKSEKQKRQEAFNLLFGSSPEEESQGNGIS